MTVTIKSNASGDDRRRIEATISRGFLLLVCIALSGNKSKKGRGMHVKSSNVLIRGAALINDRNLRRGHSFSSRTQF
jgi:hypothetical protein